MSLSPSTMWLVIGISGVLTFSLRAVFVLRPGSAEREETELPAWLQVIAPAALGALVLPAMIRPDGDWAPVGPEAVAGLLAAVVAWRTRSTVWTITIGFAGLLLLRALID